MRFLRGLLGLTGSVVVTLFGLVVVTFLIGHVMPIDPVIAMVGDEDTILAGLRSRLPS